MMVSMDMSVVVLMQHHAYDHPNAVATLAPKIYRLRYFRLAAVVMDMAEVAMMQNRGANEIDQVRIYGYVGFRIVVWSVLDLRPFG